MTNNLYSAAAMRQAEEAAARHNLSRRFRSCVFHVDGERVTAAQLLTRLSTLDDEVIRELNDAMLERLGL
jgi:hypothetical protein